MPTHEGPLGRDYARTRITDARIASRVHAALGDASSLLNVGAGAGSYEPQDRAVVALEPSARMIGQRPPGAAPAVRGVAERLPFRNASFDAVMAILTMHHWTDWRSGVREMLRVSRGCVVVFTFDPAQARQFWLVRDYLPQLADAPTEAFSFDEVVAEVGGRVEVLPVPADCTDGFLAASWRRPWRYLDPAVRQGISVFHAVDPVGLQEGLSRLEADLASGEWSRRYERDLPVDDFDGGYRLIVRT